MFPTVAITLGMSLLSPSDRYVQFWELDHPALKTPPVMRGVGPYTAEELHAVRDWIEDELKETRDRFDKEVADLEQKGVDEELVRKAKMEHNRALEQFRSLKKVIEDRVLDK